ncbi:YjeJ family protein [Klebsiella quasivariicola]|uniref:YjeJ family protein n=1 Tax=Klebsiella quasivariicola TaxID=2026240 RepID=UPI00247A83A3|nr:YjeJ family protein [Klebsiella quasivariicola]
MKKTFKGFNTAAIKYQDSFLALLLKIKQHDDFFKNYYLQANELADFLLILRSRIDIIATRLSIEGEQYKDKVVSCAETLIANTPQIEMAEVQEPNPEQRIISLTLKPEPEGATIIAALQNGQMAILYIDDMLVEPLIIAIQQALSNANEAELIQDFASSLNYLLLYTAELKDTQSIDYKQFPQEEWKLKLFSHYLAVLFCFDTEEGKTIFSGSVIKTSAAHPSEEENSIVMCILNKYPSLKAAHLHSPACQIFSSIVPSQPGRMLSLEECLRPLHAFYLEKKAELNA